MQLRRMEMLSSQLAAVLVAWRRSIIARPSVKSLFMLWLKVFSSMRSVSTVASEEVRIRIGLDQMALAKVLFLISTLYTRLLACPLLL